MTLNDIDKELLRRWILLQAVARMRERNSGMLSYPADLRSGEESEQYGEIYCAYLDWTESEDQAAMLAAGYDPDLAEDIDLDDILPLREDIRQRLSALLGTTLGKPVTNSEPCISEWRLH